MHLKSDKYLDLIAYRIPSYVFCILFFLSVFGLHAQTFQLASNNKTITCNGASNGATGVVNGKTYTKVNRTQLIAKIAANEDVTCVCTSGITNMSGLFQNNSSFNQDISSWDTSNVNNMMGLFQNASNFNQDIGYWDVSSMNDQNGVNQLFDNATNLNQDLSYWCFPNNTNIYNNRQNIWGNNNPIKNNSALRPRWSGIGSGCKTAKVAPSSDATPPTVTLSNSDNNNYVNNSQTVTITAVFSESMAATPEISITGIVTTVAMTQIASTNSYTYSWDTSSGSLSEGVFYTTVSGTDLAGNAYVAGTQSITFTLDSSTPTVTITSSDSDNIIKPGDNITVTITFNEVMASGPRITIGSAVNNQVLTATSSTTFTYSWSTSGVSAGSYKVTVTGTDLAGNTYAGNDSIKIILDATAPTVNLTDIDDDNFLVASDTVTITAIFNEAMTATPTISITGVVTNVAMLGGTVTFTASDIVTNTVEAKSVYTADLDGDGDMDIISASYLD
ncbi:MAG: BspA family leucine-rich repeat surface protein, partial [Flavobacteriaceae bacterium]